MSISLYVSPLALSISPLVDHMRSVRGYPADLTNVWLLLYRCPRRKVVTDSDSRPVKGPRKIKRGRNVRRIDSDEDKDEIDPGRGESFY